MYSKTQKRLRTFSNGLMLLIPVGPMVIISPGSMSRTNLTFITTVNVIPSGQLAPSVIHCRSVADSSLLSGSLLFEGGMWLSSVTGSTVKE